MPYRKKEAAKAASRRSYERNKEKVIAAARASKLIAREKWAAFKRTLSCAYCGEKHPATLDFHHIIRNPTNVKVHRLVGNGSFKKAIEEIKKCIVLCSNCHRKVHFEEDKVWRNQKSDSSP